MLYQIPPSNTVSLDIRQQPPDHIQLVIARPNLLASLPARLVVNFLHVLRVVLNDLDQSIRGQHFAPQIVRLQSIRVRRIARAIIPAFVERQEPRRFSLQLRAKLDLVLIQREMHQTSPQRKQRFPRITGLLVLLHRVSNRLLRQTVLQLERGYRQTVDEQT